jgi:UDP:flavonoid glycosyltransferase YjiC (YdhE family)
MANIFYAWELGANLGHIGAFLPIARQLRERKHRIEWVVAQPHRAARMLPSAGFDWLQAPLMPEVRHQAPPANYADILMRFGYAQAQDLFGLVVAWRKLMGITGARLVLADHAPTAILAARTLDLPVMLFGTGFAAPPPVHPTPNMRPWLPVPEAHLLQADAQALASINAVFQHFGKAPLERVADLFQVEEPGLRTFPELDHYEQRAGGRYWGILPYAEAAQVAPPSWPQGTGPKLFAYLRTDSAHFETALQALHQLDGSILIFAPGIAPALRERYAAEHLHFSAEPVDLRLAAQEADAALTYGSPSASVAFLLAGKPVVMLPGHLEQYLQAKRIVQLGAGLLIEPDRPATELPTLLQKILDDPSFAGNAQAFARKYADFSQEQQVAAIVQRIEQLCS